MLWQKELTKKNAMYVDLFTSEKKEYFEMCFEMSKLENKKPPVMKSGLQSLAVRREGNQLFAKDEFIKAIDKYNESLCLAPPETELVAMAYANRSTCFFKLKMYSECLVDIKLARQGGLYPASLMFKLDEREAECSKCIEGGEQKNYDIGVKLSYDPNETFPCLANVLDVGKDGKVTAKEDIGAGKTITVEKAFASYSIMGNNSKCNICLKRNTNLVPCNRCARVMLCHDQCKDNSLHEGECGLVFSGIGDLDAGILKEVRIILIVVDTFANADELMDFVEKTIKQESVTASPLSPAQIRYRDFLNLPYSGTGPNSENFLHSLYLMNKLALEVPKVNAYFKTETHRRFLLHLIGLHSQITDDNCNWSKRVFDVNGQVKNVCTHGIIGLRGSSFFGQSCAPNAMHSDHNDLSVFITIRPVKKGEPLLTFIAEYLLLEPTVIRQQAFKQNYKTLCKCSRCEGRSRATSAQQREITSDPDYSNVSSRYKSGDVGATDVQAMDEKYVTFLNKYGHIPWCDAIGRVVDAYVYFLRDVLAGAGSFSSDVMVAVTEQ